MGLRLRLFGEKRLQFLDPSDGKHGIGLILGGADLDLRDDGLGTGKGAQVQAELAEVRTRISSEAEAVGAALEADLDTFADAIGQKILGRAM